MQGDSRLVSSWLACHGIQRWIWVLHMGNGNIQIVTAVIEAALCPINRWLAFDWQWLYFYGREDQFLEVAPFKVQPVIGPGSKYPWHSC